MTALPLSLTVQSLANAMLAKSGLRSQFHLMIGITMGQLETALRTPTDYVLVIDRSGSTGSIVPGGNASILDTSKEACQSVLDLLDPADRVGVIAFDHKPDEICHLTNADSRGKIQVGNAIWGITTGGSTAFTPALEFAMSCLAGDAGRKKVIVFFTDGANAESRDPLPVCQQIQASGITLFVGGLGLDNQAEKLLEAMAGTNFKSLNNASEVSAFFAGAQAQAASAVVTNAQIRLTPVTFATVTNFELVTRGGQPNYVPADASGKLVPLGDISVGDNQQAYLGMQVVLPENIAPGRRSFGKIELIGDVPSDGRKGVVLSTTAIAVPFSATPVPGMNDAVKDMINVAATARELYKAGQATNMADMQAHLTNARKTVAFSSSAVASALSAQISTINAQAASDPAAAQRQARRATKGFSAADAAAALKGIK